MRKFLSVSILAICLFQLQQINAQCNLNPKINPSTLIFCPDATDTLSTQQYDSYQWLRDNKPIKDETHRKLILHQAQDEGYYYAVAVTKNGCADTSKRVLADGYVFNPPILIEDGDIGVFNPNLDALVECPGDTLNLLLGSTYTVNIQWYNLGKPIAGANSPSYNVVHNGSYTVCGAPAVCPNYIQCESLPLNTVFENPDVSINRSNDTLSAFPKKAKYQWYENGRKIKGANEAYYVPASQGIYTVVAYDKYTCKAISKPVFYKSKNNNVIVIASPNPVKDMLHVHLNLNNAKEIIVLDLYGNQLLQKTVKTQDENISLASLHAGTYILHVITNNNTTANSIVIVKE